MRTERGWTVEQVAEQLMCSPSKVSRLETGQRGASPRDIRDLAEIYDLDRERLQQLLDLAAEGKQRAWWQSRNLPYSHYVGFEVEAVSISDFGFGLVPGLLQTADYARAVLQSIQPPLTAAVIEQRLEARLERQALLWSDSAPTFQTVIDEAVLHRIAGGPEVMRHQLQQLLDASELPNVTIQVLPYLAGSLPVSNNKFIILAFEPPVPGLVFIEGLTGDLYLDDEDDVQAYNHAFDALKSKAADPERSRVIIASIVAALEG
jgi:transcriptional regulator with XRE-family HTH domain